MAVKHTFTSTIEDGADDTLVQPSDWNAEHVLSNALGAIDALTPAASKIAYFSGEDSATLTDITATGISLLGAANAAGARTTLELGTIATQAADNVSLTGGSISGMTSISGSTLTSTVVTGTAPFSVTSTTLVANLNTDTVDGFHASQTAAAGSIPVTAATTGNLPLIDDAAVLWGNGNCKLVGSGANKAADLYGSFHARSGSSGLTVGADASLTSLTDATVKYGRISTPHYLLAEEAAISTFMNCGAAANTLNIGGGTSAYNAATDIILYTAENYNTTTGTPRLRVLPSGRILSGQTLPADNGVDALQVNGTIASKGIKLDGTASSDTNTLDYYKEGIFAVTGVGFSDATPPTVSWVYNRVGKTVTIVAAALSGTSNATTFSVTGLPEETRPSAQRVCFIRTRDSGGVWSLGMIFINTDGTATIHKTPNADAFTASGAKAIATTMISYII